MKKLINLKRNIVTTGIALSYINIISKLSFHGVKLQMFVMHKHVNLAGNRIRKKDQETGSERNQTSFPQNMPCQQ